MLLLHTTKRQTRACNSQLTLYLHLNFRKIPIHLPCAYLCYISKFKSILSINKFVMAIYLFLLVTVLAAILDIAI